MLRLIQAQVLQDLLNNIWVFNRCDDPNWTTALLAFFDFDCEHTLEPLRPGHRVSLWFRVLLFFYPFLRNYRFTQFAVRRKAAPSKHSMKTRLGVPVSLTRGLGTSAQRHLP